KECERADLFACGGRVGLRDHALANQRQKTRQRANGNDARRSRAHERHLRLQCGSDRLDQRGIVLVVDERRDGVRRRIRQRGCREEQKKKTFHPAKTTFGLTSTGPPSRRTLTTSAIATS